MLYLVNRLINRKHKGRLIGLVAMMLLSFSVNAFAMLSMPMMMHSTHHIESMLPDAIPTDAHANVGHAHIDTDTADSNSMPCCADSLLHHANADGAMSHCAHLCASSYFIPEFALLHPPQLSQLETATSKVIGSTIKSTQVLQRPPIA